MCRNHTPHRPAASAGLSAHDAADALSIRLGVKTDHAPSQTARDYAGRRLLEVGQGLLERSGHSRRAAGDVELITRLISTSELTIVVQMVAQRAALAAYAAVPTTYQTLCARASASNFQTIERARMSGAPELLKVPEGGEIMKGPLVAGFEQYRVETYARRVALTRQAIVNDDLDTLARLPAAFGAKARQLQERLFYSLLSSNPTMSDGNALFSTAHGNLATPGAIDKTTVAEARQLMLSQTDASGTPVRVVPQYLVFGPASADDAYTFLTPAGSYPAATAADVIPEAFRNLIPIESQEITDASWYLFASPTMTPTIEHAYLNGSDGLEIVSQAGWEVLGVDTRCVLDVGFGAVDWVGVVRNPGA